MLTIMITYLKLYYSSSLQVMALLSSEHITIGQTRATKRSTIAAVIETN